MKTVAIITEYNPFHNGHLYQINKIKEELNADRIIAIMSGDFVQRGEPAIFDKYLRTEVAVSSGIDMVILLPVFFSTAPADIFAYGAINIINKLGIVDFLVFGAECESLETLKSIADAIESKASIESPEIKSLLKEGMTYARAREEILSDYKDILRGSNNILAIEYLRALKSLNSTITPYVIKRKGNDYSDTLLPDSGILASATSIRQLILHAKENASSYLQTSDVNIDKIVHFIPMNFADRYISSNILSINDFNDQLIYKLTTTSKLYDYYEVTKDLSNRIINSINEFTVASDYISILKTKETTYSRISRALIHILLDIKSTNEELKTISDNLSFVRILGARKSALSMLKNIEKSGSIHPITSVPDNEKNFSSYDRIVFEKDLLASKIYDNVLRTRYKEKTKHEYSKKPYII